MAEQLRTIADLAEARRLRLHVLPFAAGAHVLMESLMTLMISGWFKSSHSGGRQR
nr:Scr1 family TA system antitoxin-like transcriptional regulator [Streptomyces halobius]